MRTAGPFLTVAETMAFRYNIDFMNIDATATTTAAFVLSKSYNNNILTKLFSTKIREHFECIG